MSFMYGDRHNVYFHHERISRQTKSQLVNRDLHPTTMYRIQDSPPCHVFRRMALLGFLGAERWRSSPTPFQSSALALAFGKPCLLCSLAHLCVHVSHVVPLQLSTLTLQYFDPSAAPRLAET
ncbi:uncharacterized protein EAE98_000401 [Botrytis deweyae]|uniref:Uncharacterized protein n=1 Tax=Botrytis deweyae TaxID=2478750 RepID=A0ABQ7J2K2_9HELO|nr:uncharacterized protein EAE98_000401 [Botrytis deweyae]KAF7940274.1 hypothetical protein EAE98_000401 [Botrytis deweyae]